MIQEQTGQDGTNSHGGQDNGATLLTMRGIRKSFGGVHALKGVNLSVSGGEVHALIGENGAGKSTLMKVLSGALTADAGTIELNGKPFTPENPSRSRESGIAMVYQELNLAPHLTVEQNLMLGIEHTRFGFIGKGVYRERMEKALTILGHSDITPTAPVKTLPPAARQLVEIARGLMIDSKIFVMDEPTSSLSRVDTEHLFGVIETLKNDGVSVIYISHFLEEVEEIAGRFTVLRDGESVGTGTVADTPMNKIVEMMVGRTLDEMFPRIPHDIGDAALEVSALAGEDSVPKSVSFSLRRGEIMGIAGLVGAGRSETLRVLYGLRDKTGGTIKIAGVSNIPAKATPRDAMDRSISFLSEDRKNEGLALELAIADNITLSRIRRYARFGFTGNKKLRSVARKWTDALNIKVDSVTDPATSLSGGNQQKAAIARLLEEDADIFLFDEPTRGVDVGSKVDIYRLIGELASRGKAVLIVSSYLPELLGICDTIAVMHRGVLGEKHAVAKTDEVTIMNEATSGV